MRLAGYTYTPSRTIYMLMKLGQSDGAESSVPLKFASSVGSAIVNGKIGWPYNNYSSRDSCIHSLIWPPMEMRSAISATRKPAPPSILREALHTFF